MGMKYVPWLYPVYICIIVDEIKILLGNIYIAYSNDKIVAKTRIAKSQENIYVKIIFEKLSSKLSSKLW